MCSGSEAGSYLRLIDFVYHSTLGLRVIKKKKLSPLTPASREESCGERLQSHERVALGGGAKVDSERGATWLGVGKGLQPLPSLSTHP